MQSSKTQHTFLDLFSGCGGLSLGFEMAGYHSLLAIDSWQDALDTYMHNRKSARTLCGDLSQLDPQTVRSTHGISDVDVIIGGPPCQGFSLAGKRIIDDERNKLYKTFVGFVAEFQPKAFVMENVPNILTMGEGLIRERIINDFEELGYKVTVKVLVASDFGVPQNRRRAFFVGLKSQEDFTFPIEDKEHKITAKEALCDLPEGSLKDGAEYPSDAQSEFQQYARKDSLGVYNHDITIHNQKTIDIISLVPDGGNYKDLPEHLQDTRKVHIAWTRLNSSKPSFTIDCGHNHHFHYQYNRVPTARESARLQSFPDWFVFLGNKGSQLRQIGNAVPPLLAKAISEQLIKYL
jgi:DNA (cytosine-5)-methyltransferase 1